jgi:hypothetical protein
LVTKRGLKRGTCVSGTFVLKQKPHKSRAFALLGARFRELSSQICFLTEKVGQTVLDHRGGVFGKAENVKNLNK